MTVQTRDILTETSGFAAFAAAEATADGDRLPVHGVIAGEGDISSGLSGKLTRWPAEVLEAAAERDVFEGKPITVADSFDPEQHVGVEKTDTGLQLTGAVPMESKVGEITETAYEDGVGLVFSGFVNDPYAEELVERGLAQTSPVLTRQAVLLEDHDEDIPEDRELYEAQEIGQARDLALVADGGFPSNEINAGEGSLAAMASRMAAFSHSIETTPAESGVDGEQHQTIGAESPVGPDTTMDDNPDLTDEERELLRTADRYDEPVVVEREDADALSEADELLAAANDVNGDVEVIAAEEHEALTSHVETIDGELGEALVEQRGLKETTVEAMSFEAKVSEFQSEDGTLELEALAQVPETGGEGGTQSPGGGSGEGGDFELEALSTETVEEVQSLAARADSLQSVDSDYANELRSEAAEKAGVDDFETLEEEL